MAIERDNPGTIPPLIIPEDEPVSPDELARRERVIDLTLAHRATLPPSTVPADELIPLPTTSSTKFLPPYGMH